MSAGHRDLRIGHPGMRERKNSITEISDNEDELLEYHRRQREERLREQEMERLVSDMMEQCDMESSLATWNSGAPKSN